MSKKGIKKEDYAANGTQEYWIIDADQQTVEQYFLNKKQLVFKLAATLGTNDRIASKAIGGLDIPVAAIFDEKKKLEVVREMLSK